MEPSPPLDLVVDGGLNGGGCLVIRPAANEGGHLDGLQLVNNLPTAKRKRKNTTLYIKINNSPGIEALSNPFTFDHSHLGAISPNYKPL